MIGLFLVFEVMEPQGNYMEEFYGPGEYKLTWMLCCYFSCIACILYISNTHVLQLSLSVNKIIMRLVKRCI
jgi:hypothetical protein